VGLVVVDDGSYVLVDYQSAYSSTGSGYGSSHFTCYDVEGVLLWHKSISQVYVEVVLPCEGGGYYVGGSKDKQTWFAKLDSMGEVVWSRTYGSVSSRSYIPWPCVCSVIETLDGGFLLSGVDPSSERGFVVKVDGEGLVQWSRRFGGSIYEVVEVREGQYLVFSVSRIICLGSSGRVLWSESYSKYAVFKTLTVEGGLRSSVSVFVSEGGGLVVAIPYSVLGYYTSCLWVAGFVVESVSWSLFGLFVWECLFGIVVVLVFVGLWFLKNRKKVNGC